MASPCLLQPQPAPNLSIPSGSTTVNVRIVDSTARITAPVPHLMTPQISGHTHVTAASFSFLIEHPSGRKLVFDLGLRKDQKTAPPAIQKFLADSGWVTDVPKNVSDVLEEGGVSTSDIEAVIWSHHHFDHVGDMSTFPSSTTLIVGPSFKSHYMPAWPSDENSTLNEADWEGRDVREISFDNGPGLKVGPFEAFDFFGDGSYYILNSPGHTFGHIAALARVTGSGAVGGDSAQDTSTFILMGGDTCHHAGEFRPSRSQPLPKEITPSPLPQLYPLSCPGSLFQQVHPTGSAAEPFYSMPEHATVNLEEAHESIRKLKQFDAADNVLVIVAHDSSILGELDFFPETINEWKEKGYREKVRWRFLNCFDQTVSTAHGRSSEHASAI